MMGIIDAASPTVTCIKDDGSAGIVRDLSINEDAQIFVVPQSTLISGSHSGTSMTNDLLFDTYTGASTKNWANIGASVPLGGYATGPAVFSSSNTGVAIVDSASGIVTPVAAGNTTITITIPGLGVHAVAVTVAIVGGVTTKVFNSFVSGSLGAYLTTQITTLLAGRTPPSFAGSPPYAFSAQTNLFNVNGTRNTGGWWGSQDTTCIPRNAPIGSDGEHNGVLVTPRDMIYASHFGTGPVSPVFVDASNTVYTPTILTSRGITNFATNPLGQTDLEVVTFTSDLPGSIKPAKVLPANFRHYFPSVATENNSLVETLGYPACFVNQDREFLVDDLVAIIPVATSEINTTRPLTVARQSWWHQGRNLDSGCPHFLMINGDLVALFTVYGAGFYCEGAAISDNISQINAAIAANSSPHSLTTVDLSGFTSY